MLLVVFRLVYVCRWVCSRGFPGPFRFNRVCGARPSIWFRRMVKANAQSIRRGHSGLSWYECVFMYYYIICVNVILFFVRHISFSNLNAWGMMKFLFGPKKIWDIVCLCRPDGYVGPLLERPGITISAPVYQSAIGLDWKLCRSGNISEKWG